MMSAHGHLARISFLEETHAALEREIESLGTATEHEHRVAELKKKKLKLRDDIVRLRYLHEAQKEGHNETTV